MGDRVLSGGGGEGAGVGDSGEAAVKGSEAEHGRRS